MNFYPILLREIIILKRRFFRFGYLFSSMIMPLLYLIVFGLGLGKKINIEQGSYFMFIVPGICAMSSTMNSYMWLATSICVNRLHFKIIDEYLVSPITAMDIMLGEIFSGAIRGFFASSIIFIFGAFFGAGFPQNPLFYLILLLNCLIFACFGVIAGFSAKAHEDIIAFSNFFIMPMTFFCGTFFPTNKLPHFIKIILYFLPLTHTNNCLRASFSGQKIEITSFIIILFFLMLFFNWGIFTIKKVQR